MAVPTLEYKNNSKDNKWDSSDNNASIVVSTVSGGDKWTNWVEKTQQIKRTFSVSFKSAVSVEYNVK